MAQGKKRDLSVLQRPGRGRPTKLNPARYQRIITTVRATGNQSLAARVVGIGYPTMSMWIARGIEYQEHLDAGGAPEEREELYLNFARDVAKAHAEFEANLFGQLLAVSLPHEEVSVDTTETRKPDEDEPTVVTRTSRKRVAAWQGIAWALERTLPDTYARVMKQEHSGPHGGPMEVETSGVHIVEIEERDERIEAILSALADARGGPRAAEINVSRGQVGSGEIVDAASYEVPPPHTNGSSNGVPSE